MATIFPANCPRTLLAPIAISVGALELAVLFPFIVLAAILAMLIVPEPVIVPPVNPVPVATDVTVPPPAVHERVPLPLLVKTPAALLAGQL